MRRLVQRLRRLFGQSRIRLSPAELRRPAIRPGDRLQIGSRLWRVGAPGSDELELLACDGASGRARLRRPQQPASPWLLEEDDRVNVVQAADLLHFPCEGLYVAPAMA